ncbi:MAG: DUF4926 domain-containing protein [Gemmatimonadaceae bacterium]
MTFRELDTVVLDRDLPEHDLRRGDLGAVVHRHGSDAYEVEFVRASGQTQAVISLQAADIRSVHDGDLPAVRAVPPRSFTAQ